MSDSWWWWPPGLQNPRLPCPLLSPSLLRLMSIESVMPSNHLIFCCPLLFLPSIFPSIGVFSDESALHIKWPKYWIFSFSVSPSNEYHSWFPLGLTVAVGWLKEIYINKDMAMGRCFPHGWFPVLPPLWSKNHNCWSDLTLKWNTI